MRPWTCSGHNLHCLLNAACLYYYYSAVSVTVLGQTFRPKDVVCLEAPSDEHYPTFGQVVRVLVPEDFKFLVVRKLITTSYSSHFNAYHVIQSDPNHYVIVSVPELALHEVFCLYKSSFIVIRSCCHVDLLI